MSRLRFKIFSTTADVGISIFGDNLAQFYKHAAFGLNHLIFPRSVREEMKGNIASHPFSFQGDSSENVLNIYLAEILFLIYTKGQACVNVYVKDTGPGFLLADLYTCRFECLPEIEIKSVTYHNLKIELINSRLTARVIFDV